MTNARELENLIRAARIAGGKVDVARNPDGLVREVTVRGLKGVGEEPMSAIFAAERLREALADDDRRAG